jgi:hypothetical protein
MVQKLAYLVHIPGDSACAGVQGLIEAVTNLRHKACKAVEAIFLSVSLKRRIWIMRKSVIYGRQDLIHALYIPHARI